ncbi:hypothetical protein MTR67_044799 [Solanum verrucosum]|uniref:Uncharacterized protein n=1 Tax=Solanum verrucosum TaxID=315347 RepID=A0AAF0UTB6_SOLVR|nr:hypothetical protein MTR67_044799 [Solanum verrucosum]
MYSLISLPA